MMLPDILRKLADKTVGNSGDPDIRKLAAVTNARNLRALRVALGGGLAAMIAGGVDNTYNMGEFKRSMEEAGKQPGVDDRRARIIAVLEANGVPVVDKAEIIGKGFGSSPGPVYVPILDSVGGDEYSSPLTYAHEYGHHLNFREPEAQDTLRHILNPVETLILESSRKEIEDKKNRLRQEGKKIPKSMIPKDGGFKLPALLLGLGTGFTALNSIMATKEAITRPWEERRATDRGMDTMLENDIPVTEAEGAGMDHALRTYRGSSVAGIGSALTLSALLGYIARKAKMSKVPKIADITLDIDKGDTLLSGKFKNSPMTVEDFGIDDKGQPTVNDKKLLAMRIKKQMPGQEPDKKMFKKSEAAVPERIQQHSYDCGKAALEAMLKYYGINVNIPVTEHMKKNGLAFNTIEEVLHKNSVPFSMVQNADVAWLKDKLKKGPVMIGIQENGDGHYTVCKGYDKGVFRFMDPAGLETSIPEDKLTDRWLIEGDNKTMVRGFALVIRKERKKSAIDVVRYIYDMRTNYSRKKAFDNISMNTGNAFVEDEDLFREHEDWVYNSPLIQKIDELRYAAGRKDISTQERKRLIAMLIQAQKNAVEEENRLFGDRINRKSGSRKKADSCLGDQCTLESTGAMPDIMPSDPDFQVPFDDEGDPMAVPVNGIYKGAAIDVVRYIYDRRTK